MSKILITGATGLLGGLVIDFLLQKGIEANESYKVTLKQFLQYLLRLDDGQFKSEEEIDTEVLLNQPNLVIKNALQYRRWLFFRKSKAFAYRLVSMFKVGK